MMKNNMTLYVPLNKQGILDYDNCDYDSKNLLEVTLPNVECDVLYNNGLIDSFNKEFGLIISEFECEDILNENLNRVKEIISPFFDELPIFLKYLNFAIENETQISIAW